ncbi:MAG: hypothetical protein U0Q03_09135 [Acidimicrobiales bacterium]
MSADAEVLYDVWAETAAALSERWPDGTGTSTTTMSRKQRTPPARQRPGRVADPFQWWRRLCWVTPQLALCGDLPDGDAAKHRALGEWVDAGITHIVDTRLEHSDERFVRMHAPHMGYTWAGVDDHGGRQPDTWFDEGVEQTLEALEQPTAKVVVHCHMGVNRGPSMGFAAMLAMGHDPLKALHTIRSQRPIAGVLYAEDAVSWWHRRQGSDRKAIYTDTRAVRSWHQANPIDTDWITSRIWRSGS